MAGPDLVMAVLAVALGAIVQSISGVGGGFIMVPLLAMIDTRFLPGPLIFASLALSVLMAWRERRHIDFNGTGWILLAIAPGAAAGAWLVARVPPAQLGVVFGSMILLAVVISALGVHLPLNRRSAAFAGLVAGTMGASSGIGAPAIAMLYQREPGPRLRSTLAYVYTVASALIIAALVLFGRFDWSDLQAGTLLMPGFVLGYIFSRPLTVHFDRGATRYIVLGVSAAAALVLLFKSLQAT